MITKETLSGMIEHLCRNIPGLKKALDKTRLVQVPVKYKKKDGTIGTRLQWVDRSSKEAKDYAAKKPEDLKDIKAEKTKQPASGVPKKKDQGANKRAAKAEDAGPKENTYAETGKKKTKKEPKHIANVRMMDGMHIVDSVKDIPDWITVQTGKIPPGWRYIQIADDKDADRLVCGYDYEGRLQTKYSSQHTQRQAAEKFRRVAALRERQAEIREAVRGISNDDVRDCLMLIMETGLRPGSAASAKGGHYGATTLLAEHVSIEKSRVYLRFIGKEGVLQNHEIKDPYLRSMLKKRKKAAEKTESKRLFKTTPETLNKQFKAAAGSIDTSVKDLRTMKACDTAYNLLKRSTPVTTAAGFASLRNRIGEEVCAVLGNGKDMALGSYIDPKLFIAHSPVGFEKWKERLDSKAGKEEKPA